MEDSGKVHRIRLHAVLCALEANRALGTPRPVLSVELAAYAGIHGNHENKRRRVRELIAELHSTGSRICTSTGRPADCGCWIARDDAEWAAYQESKRKAARFQFARVRAMATAANERQSGQGKMFDAERLEWARR
jgi:hypothetical protein